VTRSAPGVAAVVTALLMGLTACGNHGGASGGTLQTPSAPAADHGAPAERATTSALAGLAVLPRGFVADAQSPPGPFTATAFLDKWSADPALDRALLLNASFVEGYRASRISPDQRKRFTVQLFTAGSAAKARTLQHGFWAQETHEHSFAVPDALTDARVQYDGGADKSVAIAEASFVVGAMVVELTVRQNGELGTDLEPDTALITNVAKLQRARLTATSG